MAVTKELLTEIGLSAEHHEAVINAHLDTVNGLKEEIERYQREAEEASEAVRELEKLQIAEEEYNRLHAEFEAYKAETAKVSACEKFLASLGLSPNYVDRLKTNSVVLGMVELDGKNNIKDASKLESMIIEDFGFAIKHDNPEMYEARKSQALARIRRKAGK